MNQVTLFHAVKKSFALCRIRLLNAKTFISVSGHACSPLCIPQQPVLVSVKTIKMQYAIDKSDFSRFFMPVLPVQSPNYSEKKVYSMKLLVRKSVGWMGSMTMYGKNMAILV